jgi:hypothetical protein
MDEELLVRPYAAYHEAGHAVVSLALGLRVNKVWIDGRGVGCTESHSEAHLHPHLLRTKAERLAAAREVLAIHVAGHVANHLRDQWAWFGRWPTRREIRERPEASDSSSAALVSSRFAAGDATLDNRDDLFKAEMAATGIWKLGSRGRRLRPVGGDGEIVAAVVVPREALLAEILRAERRAEKLLKRHWQAVEAIAGKLWQGKSGKLMHAQLMKLVGHHFQPAA